MLWIEFRVQNRPRTDCSCQTIESSKTPPQSNKVRVPTSRTRVMIGERRDRGAGPPAEEDVTTPGDVLEVGKRRSSRSSSRPGSRGAFGRRGRPERVRGSPQIDRGKGRRLGRVPNARRLPATVDRSPLERTSPRRSTPAVGHSPSGCILARPVAVRRADRSRGPRPFDLWARGGLSSGAAPGPGSAGREPSSGAPVSRAAPHS